MSGDGRVGGKVMEKEKRAEKNNGMREASFGGV